MTQMWTYDTEEVGAWLAVEVLQCGTFSVASLIGVTIRTNIPTCEYKKFVV